MNELIPFQIKIAFWHVHMFWGFWGTLIASYLLKIKKDAWVLTTGFGIGMEVTQAGMGLGSGLLDALLDITSWVAGGALTMLIERPNK